MAAPVVLDTVEAFTQFLAGPMGPARRVWAYLRVSSKKQERDGLGLEGQRDAVLSYCKKKELPEPVFVREVASAAAPLLTTRLPGLAEESGGEGAEVRPLITQLLARLCERGGNSRHLLLWKLDRLSRHGYEQDMLISMMQRAEVTIHSTQGQEEDIITNGPADPARQLMRHVLAGVAQYERFLMRQRLQMGLRAKAARGGWTSGAPPHGYCLKDRDLAIEPDEALDVAAVFYLRNQSYSYRVISEELVRRFRRQPMKRMKINRILNNRDVYEGRLHDPYGGVHERPDLRILPTDWRSWAEEHDPYYQKEA